MTAPEKEVWLQTTQKKLTIGQHHHHHFAREIVSSNPVLEQNFLQVFESEIFIEPRIKETKGIESKAIKAKMLNKEIRRLLLESQLKHHLKLEVSEERGVFYFSEEKGSIGGFDFAIVNHVRNLTKLYSLCYGDLRYANGPKRWTRFINRNPELAELAREIEKSEIFKFTEATDRVGSEDYPLIVGEIQFGNWGLAYRDFFKVLKANVSNSIDCLIYVVPTGSLEAMLSDGIVTFSKAKAILDEFEKVISVPVWLIGLDFDD